MIAPGKDVSELEDAGHASDDADKCATASPTRPRMKRSQLFIGAVLGGVVTFLVGVVIIVALNRDSLPVLTAERLETAQFLWQNSKINSYSMTIELRGAQPGRIEIEVQNGEPVRLIRDGVEPARRTWDAWTIPGQFEMIELDMANKTSPKEAFRVEDAADVSVSAVFDDRNGIPRHYRRTVQGQPYTVEWIITDFEPNRP